MIMLSTPKELIENANKIQRYFKYSLTTAILLLTLSACGGGGGSTSFDDTTTLNAPIITSNDTVSINENQTAAVTVTATDADGNTLTYSLTGADASSFDINATTGVVTFKIPPDYETKSSYIFTANVNDGANTATQRITVTVINVAEFVPIISSLTSSIDENVAVGTVVNSINIFNSGDSPITSFTLSDTTDFGISASGEITTKTPLDFETTAEYNLSAFASNSAGDSVSESVIIKINDIYEVIPVYIPTLVVVMNWTDYSELDPLIWHEKFFDITQNSVNRWFDETTGGELVLVPVTESSGTANDGLIIVSMGKPHPGDYNNTTFRDTEIYNAITNSAVVDSMDFAALDTDGDGRLNKKELQIVFIVAGGESSYGDAVDHSIWAHAWSFDSASTLSVDGVLVMKYTGLNATSGSYARFGANHGTHKATIGIIAHELGHSLLSLGDYYSDSGDGFGSGLGWYDIMSNGSWARQATDIYPGETPTQYTAYNRIDAGLNVNATDASSSQDLNITCSSRELIKLVTTKANEYFLIECRDTAKPNSDISFEYAESTFTNNKLFAMLYHVDTLKTGNNEDGLQTDLNHYKVALVEKDTATLMTSATSISANYADVYSSGDTIDVTKTKFYNTTGTGYSVEIINQNYTDRTMTIRITKI